MMTDLTGSEKTTLNTFVERAIADDRQLSPRIRTLDMLVAELEPPSTIVAVQLLAAASDDRPRETSTR
jgi:hypothetical protein